MRKLISRLMERAGLKNTQACLVLVGNDLEMLSQYLQEKPYEQQHTIFQIIADDTMNTLPAISNRVGVQQLHLNLNNTHLVNTFFTHLSKLGYRIDLCIFQTTWQTDQSTISPIQQLQYDWQKYALTTITVAQATIRQMLFKSRGTLVFLAGGQCVRPEDDFVQQSIQSSIQAMAQSLAREFQPKGIHVVYCALTKWSATDAVFMQEVSRVCWHLHQQPNSTWSQELRI